MFILRLASLGRRHYEKQRCYSFTKQSLRYPKEQHTEKKAVSQIGVSKLKTRPSFMAASFTCPHCQSIAQQSWFNGGTVSELVIKIIKHIYLDHRPNFHDYEQTAMLKLVEIVRSDFLTLTTKFIPSNFSIATCTHCDNVSLWIDRNIVYPKMIIAPPAHPDMPPEIRVDYDEARNIAQDSPRGSAALLRLCVQKICIHLGEPGKKINDDIGALVKKGLPVEIQQALDLVRVIGNNAVHPGELSSEDVQDVADNLFEIVNHIVEERISRPKKLSSLFSGLPTQALESIKKRDGSKQP